MYCIYIFAGQVNVEVAQSDAAMDCSDIQDAGMLTEETTRERTHFVQIIKSKFSQFLSTKLFVCEYHANIKW